MLRSMIEGGKNPRCFETKRNNFFILERVGGLKSTEFYHVFFDLYRSPDAHRAPGLVMYVQSAYVKNVPMRRKRTDSTLFAAVCSRKMAR